MFKYIVQDMEDAMSFLPYGLVAGIICLIMLLVWSRRNKEKQAERIPIVAYISFLMYAAILLGITFFSRESGSRNGIDLELFSTWGINARNNAFVIENILLFMPYGVVSAWAIKGARSLFTCTLFGAVTSLGIECMQLITRRGYFQIDDILTNTLGAAIGYLIFRYLTGRFWKR